MSDLIWLHDAVNVADMADYTGLSVEDVKKVTDEVVKGLKALQTVDAVPVVHGHWKGYRFPKYRGNDDFGEPIFKEYVAYTCSNCRKQNAIRHKYCPMCGAIMDGVTE